MVAHVRARRVARQRKRGFAGWVCHIAWWLAVGCWQRMAHVREHERERRVDLEAGVRYLNRLSDYLFTLARHVQHASGRRDETV